MLISHLKKRYLKLSFTDYSLTDNYSNYMMNDWATKMQQNNMQNRYNSRLYLHQTPGSSLASISTICQKKMARQHCNDNYIKDEGDISMPVFICYLPWSTSRCVKLLPTSRSLLSVKRISFGFYSVPAVYQCVGELARLVVGWKLIVWCICWSDQTAAARLIAAVDMTAAWWWQPWFVVWNRRGFWNGYSLCHKWKDYRKKLFSLLNSIISKFFRSRHCHFMSVDFEMVNQIDLFIYLFFFLF